MMAGSGSRQPSDPGADLYRLVEAYSALGNHRTGTDVDGATRDWFAAEARSRGARVRTREYSVPVFRARATLQCDRADIEIEPLFYSFRGEGETGRVFVIGHDDPHESGAQSFDSFLEGALVAARTEGAEAIVIATQSPNEGLVAMNRAPGPPLALPVFLAAGRDFARLKSGILRLRFAGQIETGTSANVIAEFGAFGTGRSPIVVTTPLSGWFGCAGERGTGLAIALSVAARLAVDWPVRLVVPSGHELGYFGGADYLDGSVEPFRAVLHLGSCVAAFGAVPRTGKAGRGDLRVVANLPDAAFTAVSSHLRPVDLVAERPENPPDPACWIGESELWCPFLAEGDFPMVSIAGTSPLFHTREDQPEAATSPQLLVRMDQVVNRIAAELVP